jgi:acyl-CoA synthetase (AMP-forming)/AMP-acid ligase II
VSLCVLPLSHAFGLILMLMSIREGAVFVMLRKFELMRFFEAAERFMVA